MQYGMNLLLWTDTLGEDTLPLLEKLKEIGYDAVELPMFDVDPANYAPWKDRLDGLGLKRTGVTVRGGDSNPMSNDPNERKKGVADNKAAVECCQAVGADTLVGPFHSGLGVFSGQGPTNDEWKWAVDGMREVAEHAEKCGVTLALEYLNRFECYLLNTAADTARFCKDVNHPRCKAMYDTFHSHIEEKNVPEAIKALKGQLAHVHVSENDRSTPGKGNVRWDETFDALKAIGYDGMMTVEAFGVALEKLIPATKIWRRMYDTEEQLARDALTFMKAEVGKRW